MPHARSNNRLSAFARRDTFEKVMFGYVWGIRRGLTIGLPGVTDEKAQEHISVHKALEQFAKEFDLPPHVFNVESSERVYHRIVKEFWEDQKAKQEQPA